MSDVESESASTSAATTAPSIGHAAPLVVSLPEEPLSLELPVSPSPSAAAAASSAAMAAAVAVATADAIATADAMASAAVANAAASAAIQGALNAGSMFSSSSSSAEVASSLSHPPTAAAAAAAAAPPPPPKTQAKSTRSCNLTHEQKRMICLYAKQNPTFTQVQLGQWAKEHFGLATIPSQSSISHTLKRRHTFVHMKTEDWSSKRMRAVKHPDLDTALANWFLYTQATQPRIQGDEIKAKAQIFFDLMQLQSSSPAEPPQFSNGWLHSFQSRHGFTRSPSAHTPEPEMITSREELVDATKSFAPWDVYWMDETKLSYALNPERLVETDSEAAAALAAQDKQMTIAFCCNTDGSELLDPFFLCDGRLDVAAEATSSASSAATTQAVEYGFTYAYNKKMWMTPTVFREWLLAFDWKMHEENRHVLLLVDSFSSHQLKRITLKNVAVRFVAQTPFGESYLDSVHRTILSGVKRRYRQLYLDTVLDRREEAGGSHSSNLYEVDILDAIQWVLKTWRELPKSLVANAFAHVGIAKESTGATPAATLPGDASGSSGAAAIEQTEESLDAQLTALLKRLKLKPSLAPIKLSDFISPPNELIVDMDMTDQDFVSCALDSGMRTTVSGRNTEPPRKIARVGKPKKAFPPGFGPGATTIRHAAQTAAPPSSSGALARSMAGATADDLASTPVPDAEWQAWADSQRCRTDEVHALETVIRLASDMNCEPATLLDLTRMQAELLHKRQSERGITTGAAPVGGSTVTPGDTAAGGTASDGGKQPTGVCRFSFGVTF